MAEGAVHAICEDYRAAAGIDLEHDRQDDAAGRRIVAPLLALWGGKGTVGALYDVLATWRRRRIGSRAPRWPAVTSCRRRHRKNSWHASSRSYAADPLSAALQMPFAEPPARIDPRPPVPGCELRRGTTVRRRPDPAGTARPLVQHPERVEIGVCCCWKDRACPCAARKSLMLLRFELGSP